MLRPLIAILIILMVRNYYDCLLLGQAHQSPLLNTALLVRRLLKLLIAQTTLSGHVGDRLPGQPTFRGDTASVY